ncbi:MAG TPA: DUF6186 family protein [Streptosporangiaceae bacterium]|nr:DUF6186 family protein [Streptosporangiaceae bacterium]
MNSHDVTVTGFLVLLATLVGTEIVGRSRRTPVPTFSQMMTRIMRTRTGRVGLLVAWAWLGLHFFAK